ncbi:MAG: cob(I)yrinic acid a,c-diamide adenosyltransferase [Acetivibrionales bacterium]|jgi:cob(I)alamin adenosyltransferase|nr:cob(I)yrinic acid a,c-diamide adenosyltransferase [Clostridiaceae bacterium]
MIHTYIGDGKGKTTAAIGLAIRNLGCDGEILFSQFLKSSDTGEMKILTGLNGVTFIRPYMRHKDFVFNVNESQLSEIKEDIVKGFNKIKDIISNGDFSLIVFDEILDVIDLGLLHEEELIAVFDKFPSAEFVITGRKASQAIKDKVDYITVMKKEKHPFDKGIRARKGIEY